MNYQLESKFCGNSFDILRYSPHKTEFNNLGPVIRARYLVNLLLFEGIFGTVFRAML